jgi:hypothetical protein
VPHARARRRRIELGFEAVPVPAPRPRSPEEVEAAIQHDDRNYGYISAAIDFIHNVEEDVLRKTTAHLLRKP